MNRKTLIALAAAAVLAAPVLAQTGGGVVATAPGKAVIAETVKITATITAIDKATRDVTLKGPQGNELTVTAGPDVKNFDQLKVGDQVALQYVEALSLELKKGGGAKVAKTEKTDAVAAKKGEAPGGAAGRQVTVVADVVALDPAKQIVTLKGPKQTVNLRVPDPAQFKNIAKGDQVEATFTQAMAVAVEPAAPKK
jgi:Cu/Ag efflux protein CusF